jgi:hypothetical protein
MAGEIAVNKGDTSGAAVNERYCFHGAVIGKQGTGEDKVFAF